VLLLFVGVALIPTSVMGHAKLGGADNSLAFSVLFLLAAATCRLSAIADPLRAVARLVPAALLTLALTLALALLALDTSTWSRAAERLERFPENRHATAYRLAREAPGRYYFPWNTLSTVLAEQEFLHFSYGLFDLNLAGFLPEATSLHRHFPAQLEFVAFHDTRQGVSVLQYLQEFRATVERADLPDWVVYVRGQGAR
jgi:hypothetical protein